MTAYRQAGRRHGGTLAHCLLLSAVGLIGVTHRVGGMAWRPGFVQGSPSCSRSHLAGRTGSVSAAARGGGEEAAAAPPVPQRVAVPVPGVGKVSIEFTRRLGKESALDVVTAEIPMGLKIIQREDDKAFIVEEILSGGSISRGLADVQEGDVVHAVSTESDGKKGLIETTSLEDTDELTQAILGNDDGSVTMLVERMGAGGGSGIAFLTDIARML